MKRKNNLRLIERSIIFYEPIVYKGFIGKIKYDKGYDLFFVECDAVEENILGNTREEAELNFKTCVDAILSC